ncbi:hypothetical protein CR203_14830 [Salipaludibacillus neizhouensis]|uniref:Uncharacterized protein n=1 Tax=Salipaludibacillus neizhouensis TaxID=885475 RepID=A0A3A9K6R4_9BACI|nr:hypothetical protein [Salipaludibacillus neizhouensis]RKL66560.1 hypothetical protein CR203_14830 [Salipaludibacillus neizhouensis]
MSEITFLASSKPFIIPDEIQKYNNRTVFEREVDIINLWVNEVDTFGWGGFVEGLFTMPYIYEISGAGNELFLLYLEMHMEIGDVLELLHFPNQHAFEYYQRRLMENPEPININGGKLTYQDKYGTYQLNPKKWVEELSHKIYLTEYGVTTIVKY